MSFQFEKYARLETLIQRAVYVQFSYRQDLWTTVHDFLKTLTTDDKEFIRRQGIHASTPSLDVVRQLDRGLRDLLWEVTGSACYRGYREPPPRDMALEFFGPERFAVTSSEIIEMVSEMKRRGETDATIQNAILLHAMVQINVVIADHGKEEPMSPEPPPRDIALDFFGPEGFADVPHDIVEKVQEMKGNKEPDTAIVNAIVFHALSKINEAVGDICSTIDTNLQILTLSHSTAVYCRFLMRSPISVGLTPDDFKALDSILNIEEEGSDHPSDDVDEGGSPDDDDEGGSPDDDEYANIAWFDQYDKIHENIDIITDDNKIRVFHDISLAILRPLEGVTDLVAEHAAFRDRLMEIVTKTRSALLTNDKTRRKAISLLRGRDTIFSIRYDIRTLTLENAQDSYDICGLPGAIVNGTVMRTDRMGRRVLGIAADLSMDTRFADRGLCDDDLLEEFEAGLEGRSGSHANEYFHCQSVEHTLSVIARFARICPKLQHWIRERLDIFVGGAEAADRCLACAYRAVLLALEPC